MPAFPGESAPHGKNLFLTCAKCYRGVAIQWGSNSTGFAECRYCGQRYIFKHVYDKFVLA